MHADAHTTHANPKFPNQFLLFFYSFRIPNLPDPKVPVQVKAQRICKTHNPNPHRLKRNRQGPFGDQTRTVSVVAVQHRSGMELLINLIIKTGNPTSQVPMLPSPPFSETVALLPAGNLLLHGRCSLFHPNPTKAGFPCLRTCTVAQHCACTTSLQY